MRKRKRQPSMKTTVESQIVSDVYFEVEQRFRGMGDPAHGWQHIRRVYELALHIAEQEGADSFIVGMAALLHDLGRLSQDYTKHHVDLSVINATELLATYEVPSKAQEAILHAIAAHSFSRGIEARTLEARVVRDADRLDSLGAIGILRWAITGTLRRTAETISYDPDDPFAERRRPDDGHFILDHFYTKLFKLYDTISTETGRKLAQRRTEFMRAYLEEFRRELEV